VQPSLAFHAQREGLLGDALQVVSLDEADGPEIARLRLATRERGLSLADRACLALAQRLALPALTADRAWAGLELDLAVTVETREILTAHAARGPRHLGVKARLTTEIERIQSRARGATKPADLSHPAWLDP
jgi:hypothetical protein